MKEDRRALEDDLRYCSRKEGSGHFGLGGFWKARMDICGHTLKLIGRPVACSG